MKYAIVTGASRGLGVGIVHALFEYHVVEHVAVISRTAPPESARFDSNVHFFAADVTHEAQIHSAVEAIAEKLGPHPQVLCNNAGGGERQWFDRRFENEWESVEAFRYYVDLNLNAVHIVTREVAPRMLEGAAICNVSSVGGQIPSPVLASYAAAKAGVNSYTRTCALQLAAKGIRVNAVAPGLIYTPLWADLGAVLGGGDDKSRATFDAAVTQLTPLGREQTIEDIGRAVAWLCSDHAGNVTGQILPVDGGLTLGSNPLKRG